MSLFLQIITIYTVCTHFYDVWWSCHSPVIQWILINGCFGAVYILRCSDWDDQVLAQTTNLTAFFLAIMPKYNNVSTHSRRKYDCCTFHSSLRSLSLSGAPWAAPYSSTIHLYCRTNPWHSTSTGIHHAYSPAPPLIICNLGTCFTSARVFVCFTCNIMTSHATIN